jgi:hypothetical protein
MLTPPSRKPVEIPSFPPIGGDASIRVSRRTEAEVRARRTHASAEPASAHDQNGTKHRRLAKRRAGAQMPPNAGRAGGGDPAPSTFRGATARFVAFG